MALLSQWKLTFICDLVPWLCIVIDTAESKLGSVINTTQPKLSRVNDTAESKLRGIIGTAAKVQTPLSQFEKLVKALDSLKRKSNQNSSKDELYYPRPLRQNLKNSMWFPKETFLTQRCHSLTLLSQLWIWISQQIQSYIRKHFGVWKSGPKEDVWWKRTGVKNLIRLSL
jgi:hypothetical protein